MGFQANVKAYGSSKKAKITLPSLTSGVATRLAVRDRTDTVRGVGLYWPMFRFFFQIRTDTALIEDPEGIDLSHLEAARAEATAGLRLLAAEALRQNLPASNRQVDIYDVAGLLLATVSAQDAIRPLLP